MLKLFLTTLLILLFSIGVEINGAVNAQTNTRQINTAMKDIRLAVVKNLGSQDKEVEVKVRLARRKGSYSLARDLGLSRPKKRESSTP